MAFVKSAQENAALQRGKAARPAYTSVIGITDYAVVSIGFSIHISSGKQLLKRGTKAVRF